MVVALFAVAMLGGSELPILNAPQFAEAHAFVHRHANGSPGDLSHHDDILSAHSDATHDHSDGDRQPSSPDHGCTHVHAHCCSATAILMTVAVASGARDASPLRFEANGSIPYGQLAQPLLRPPRLKA